MLEGAPPKNVNTMAPLLAMAYLYEDTKDSRYLPYLEQWAEWVMHDMPRTDENGLQHATYGPENRNQLWDDTLMMTALPLAKIGMLLNRPAYIEEAKQQFMIHIKYLVDKKLGFGSTAGPLKNATIMHKRFGQEATAGSPLRFLRSLTFSTCKKEMRYVAS